MTDINLPDELATFEAELQALPRGQMPSTLRERVLDDLQAELSTRALTLATLSDSSSGSDRWWFAACAAMVAMLWLNFSLVAARGVGEAWQHSESLPTATTLAETQAALATLLPELSPADAQGYAITLYSGTQSTLLPVPGLPQSSQYSARAN
jgi:hypothetical protein